MTISLKQLEWEDQYNICRATFDFGWVSIYYTVRRKDIPLDTWSVAAGAHDAAYGPHRIHLCAGLDNAKAAAQADFERLISSAMERQQ